MKHRPLENARRVFVLAGLALACFVLLAACSPPAQSPVTPEPEPATPVPRTVEAATPPPQPPAVQLGDAPRLKEDAR
jgi:hypothetical protein